MSPPRDAPRDAIVIVGVNVAATVGKVLARIPEGYTVIVVDDGSTDGTAQRVPQGVILKRHERNRGYGAAQKPGYAAARDAGAERVALLHGDDQYDADDVMALLTALDDADVALGSRFLAADRGAIIPWWRRLANRGLTETANLMLSIRATDLHTGARAFRLAPLFDLPLDTFSDDYVFDQQVLVGLAVNGARFAERPVRVRYDDEVQSISFRRSVVYGLGCVRAILAARHSGAGRSA